MDGDPAQQQHLPPASVVQPEASVTSAPAPEPLAPEILAVGRAVFDQVKAQFSAQFAELQTELGDMLRREAQSGAQLAELRKELGDALRRVAVLETELQNTQAHVARGIASHAPKVSPPAKFDGKPPKDLADQFIRQISNAALFESFVSDEQKILWAESFLTGQAFSWSSTLTSHGDRDSNPARFVWTEWIRLFKETFCTRDAAAEALRKLSVLVQGSKSITQYCTEFKELTVKLAAADQGSEFVKERFWAGLNVAAKEALVNTDYRTVDEAQDILLRREARLADIEVAKRQGKQAGSQGSGASSGAKPAVPARPVGNQSATLPAAVKSNPPASRDPNAMDVDAAKRVSGRSRRTCFACGGEGHFAVDCPTYAASLKAALIKEVLAMQKAASGSGSSPSEEPGKGFA